MEYLSEKLSSSDPQPIKMDLLKTITQDFSPEMKIGSGGFGEVYKGVFHGDEIAVKRLFSVRKLDDQAFDNEFRNLVKVRHKNVIRMIGYCYEITHTDVEDQGWSLVIHRALCFEFMKGGTLATHISAESCIHDWPTTYKIISGICEGLHHLHKGEETTIYHLDLKPDNVLLDEELVPKIGDFGLSMLFGSSYTHQMSTTNGTIEFMPQEYINNHMVSLKHDVFSLGVIIFHMMAGEKVYDDYRDARRRANFSPKIEQYYLDNVQEYWKTKMQASKGYRWDKTDVLGVTKCIEMAMHCVEDDRHIRPSITKIMGDLKELDSNILEMLKDEPKPLTPRQLFLLEKEFAEHYKFRTRAGAKLSEIKVDTASSVLEHIILNKSEEPTNVPLALLQHITKDFSDKRQIGRGGFGVVYKGHLQNGSVAVKRLFNAHTIDEVLFYHEATCLIGVKHKNIVRFLCYCANTESKLMPNPNTEETTRYILAENRERLLCFEYIKNGSLDKYLTDELRGLEWHTRYEIIKGICNGLDYLHNEKGIIHRDLKPANILVDDLMVPKITDFGISKLLNGATHVVTSNSTMSIGYTAPEFIHHGVVSFKSDIYSLGVIIAELMTGRRGDPDTKNVLRRWRYRWNKSVQYPPFGYQQVTKCMEIASTCLSRSPQKRPYATDILSMLDAIESMDVQINNEWPDKPLSMGDWELLEFDKLELNFPFEINKQIPCSIELTNLTDGDTAFDIQKPGILNYCIEPSKGVVPARSKCTVIVTLQAREVAPHATMCKDEFVVRCAAVNEGLTAEDIHQDMFNNGPGKLVDEVMLTVIVECVAITE